MTRNRRALGALGSIAIATALALTGCTPTQMATQAAGEPNAAADFSFYPTIRELDLDSTIVARGTVLDARVDYIDTGIPIDPEIPLEEQLLEGMIYRFEVAEFYQSNEHAAQVIEVMQAGLVSGPEILEIGTEYVLFLAANVAGPAGIVGGPAGTFIVQDDELLSQATALQPQARGGEEQVEYVQISWDELEALPEH